MSFSGSQRPVHRSGSHTGSRDGSQPRHGPRRLESLRLFWRQLHHGRSAQVRTEAEVKVGGETEAVRERYTMTHVIQSDAVSFYRPRLSYTCVSEQMINLQHDDQTINEEKPRDSDRTQTIKLFLSKKKNSFTTFVEIQTPRCTLNKKFQWTRDKSQTSETPLTKYPQKDLYLYIFWGVLKDFPIQTISFFPISNLLPISIIYIWLKVFITMFIWSWCWRLFPHVDQKRAKK